MSARVLLNLLYKLRKDKMRGLPSILSIFFAMNLINSQIQELEVRFYLSYDIKIIFKAYFWCENVRVLPYV